MSNYSTIKDTKAVNNRSQIIQSLIKIIAEIDENKFTDTKNLGFNLSKEEMYPQKTTLNEKVKIRKIELIINSLIKTDDKQNKAAGLLEKNIAILNFKVKRNNLPIRKFATHNHINLIPEVD